MNPAMMIRVHTDALINECRFYDGKNRTHMTKAVSQLKDYVETLAPKEAPDARQK
jgi:hypothetical protein